LNAEQQLRRLLVSSDEIADDSRQIGRQRQTAFIARNALASPPAKVVGSDIVARERS
jgi:hypothetical protein